MASFEQTTLDAVVTKTTDNAVLVEIDGKEVWIPRKVCLQGNELEEDDNEVMVANWWLKQEGLL